MGALAARARHWHHGFLCACHSQSLRNAAGEGMCVRDSLASGTRAPHVLDGAGSWLTASVSSLRSHLPYTASTIDRQCAGVELAGHEGLLVGHGAER